jgi:hypothetical protein
VVLEQDPAVGPHAQEEVFSLIVVFVSEFSACREDAIFAEIFSRATPRTGVG